MANKNQSSSIDPATVEVIQNYLSSAAGEMHRTLKRTAYNQIIYELIDFGITIYDRNLNLIADSPGLAAFIGANDSAIKKGVEHVGENNIHEGDIIMLNYPYWSAGHPNDAVLFSPIYFDNNLVGYSAIRAHWVDMGGKDTSFQTDTTNVHQEGLIMPAVKVYKQGEPDEEMLDIIRFNSRMPRDNIGNLNAQVSSIRVGEKRVQELYEKYGEKTVESCIEQMLDEGERIVRERLQELPDGTWTAVDYLDDDGINNEKVKLVVKVTIDADEIFMDFSESDKETDGPVNAPYGRTVTASKLATKALTSADKLTNGGHYRPLTVIAPEGSVFHATYPAPTYTHWSSSVAADTILHALAKGMPEIMPAGSAAEICSVNFYGTNPKNGEQFVGFNNEGIGWGASKDHDGANSQCWYRLGSMQNIPTEFTEHKMPLIVEQYKLRQNSGGPGEYHGGLGVRRDYRVTGPLTAVAVWKKTKTDSWGLKGGKAGARNSIIWYPGTGKEMRKGTHRGKLESGERLSVRSGGGGGYGNPFNRDPEKVRQDVLDEYISPGEAHEKYGVEISSDGEINWEKTKDLRAEPD